MLSISFNTDWLLHSQEHVFPGTPEPAPKTVTLPHDAMISQPRGKNSGRSKGFFPNINTKYTKNFFVEESCRNKNIYFQFEGIYMNSRIYINDEFVEKCPYGYIDINICADKYLKYGKNNKITVIATSADDSRWYSGAGIYRNVWMFEANQLHIALDSVKITTLSAEKDFATVNVALSIENNTSQRRTLTWHVRFIDDNNTIGAKASQSVTINANSTETPSTRLFIENPRLWDLDCPNLYDCILWLEENSEIIDQSVIRTGIRKLNLDNRHGLTINRKTVKLYGGCIHHDNGLLGSATIDRAEERRIEKLKTAGYNAIRSAHQPVSKSILQACDKYGIAVIDEFSDMWYQSKSPFDYSNDFEQYWEQDLEKMIAKDYNHPSVVIYSIGNEIPEVGTSYGAMTARKLTNKIRQLDPSRYTTIAVNNILCCMDSFISYLNAEYKDKAFEMLDRIMRGRDELSETIQEEPFIVNATHEAYEAVDIAGYNYASNRYEHDSKLFDNWICIGTETYPKDLHKNWSIVQKNANVLGDFCWTAWDYLGEAGIGKYEFKIPSMEFLTSYPYYIAYCADFDITGHLLPQGYYRSIVIGRRTAPYIAVEDPAFYEQEPQIVSWSWSCKTSSWNWKGYEKKNIRVEVYGIGDEAELFVNGKSVERKAVPQVSNFHQQYAYLTVFDTIYEPGEVVAVIYTNHTETGRYTLKTAGDHIHIQALPDCTEIKNTSHSLCYVDISLCDDNGIVNTDADTDIHVTVTGAAVLAALGTKDPESTQNSTADFCTTHDGHALAILRPADTGIACISISANGYETVKKTITVL